MEFEDLNACVIIPARFKSSRFPGKPIAKILNKEMVIWVANLSAKAVGIANVFVATDDERIANVVKNYGYKVFITDKNHLTGTDRVAEVANKLNYKIIVNVQGDEPMIDPDDIIKAIKLKKEFPNYVINSYCFLKEDENPNSLNIPKVVTTEDQNLIYISRSMIPLSKETNDKSTNFKKQVCIYAFNKKELKEFLDFGRKSELEKIEDIEILRFFELNKNIKMFRTNKPSLAVDVLEDLYNVEKALLKKL